MRRARLLSGAIIATVTALTVATAATGSDPQGASGNDFCVTRIEHIRPGSDEARIVSDECYATAQELYDRVGRGGEEGTAAIAIDRGSLVSDSDAGRPDATITVEPAYPRSGSGRICVARVEPTSPGSPEARIVRETCFDRVADALREASGGAVDLPSDTPTRTALQTLDAMEGPIGTLSDFVIGIDHDDVNYDDAHGLRIWEAASGCGPGVAWNVSNIGASWNDRVSSAKGKSDCDRFIHFEAIDYGGSSRTCTPNCATMGVMNDAASSLQFKP